VEKSDVLVVGDALIDMFLSISAADEHCHVNEAKYEICFTRGAKIPIDDCKFLLGGNACNVSVGLSRLGIKAGIGAEIGDDEFSKKIVSGLQKENVSLEFLKQVPGEEASFAIDLTFMNDRTILSRHKKRSHEISIENAQCAWVYLTSLGEEWEPLYKRVTEFVQNNNIKLAFNPGSRQLKEGLDSFRSILPNTTILFINKEEAEDMVYGKDQGLSDEQKKPEILLQKIRELGPKEVSMTDGEKGSYFMDENGKMFFQGIIPAKFVQKTGVGDAYASGFVAGIVNGKTVQQAMLSGAINSSSVTEHIVAQTGLLRKEEMEKRL